MATGLGYFDVRIKTIEHSVLTEEAYYNDIPLDSVSNNIEITVDDKGPDYQIKFDKSGGKTFERRILPSTILNAKEASDKIKPKIETREENSKIVISASDDNSGILKIEYSLDDGKTWIIYDKPIVLSKEIDGNKVIYRATDRAGNISVISNY